MTYCVREHVRENIMIIYGQIVYYCLQYTIDIPCLRSIDEYYNIPIIPYVFSIEILKAVD